MENFWTIFGIWIGVFCTFAIWSFLYKDNPFYKVAEHIFVGMSAAYWFVFTIFNIVIPNLITPLSSDFQSNWLLIVPGLLGIMMLARLLPKVDWLGKYPLALMIGTTAGISLIKFLKTDVMIQVTSTILNPLNAESLRDTVGQFVLILGTIAGLVYFYFSKKHTGFTGSVARAGIIVLMISFGAAFGFTAMARISLLIGRLQFLLGDWLGLLN